MKMIEQTQYDAISHKAVQVIGRDLIRQMSAPQRGLLNKALNRLLERHKGSADSVTKDEIEGQYEMIVRHVLPTGSHEHLLK